MSQSVALCSEGGKFFNTTERSRFSEGEKEKNISKPVLKNEATPSSYEELKKRILDYGFEVYEEEEGATVYRKVLENVPDGYCELLIGWPFRNMIYPYMNLTNHYTFSEKLEKKIIHAMELFNPEDFNFIIERLSISLEVR